MIEATALTKRFGNRVAVNNVTLNVPRGSCVGFLGPNGAGKTTMMRLVLGLARPSSGSVKVRGFDVATDLPRALQRVAGIVEEPRFYPYLNARDNLRVYAGLLDEAAFGRIDDVLATVHLKGRERELVKRYSLGMRTRLGLARALLCDPELLVLDEPTNGLDADGMAEFREMTTEIIRQGRTIMISSHLLDEMQKIVDYVAIVNHGSVVMEGPLQSLLDTGDSGLDVECSDASRAVEVMQGLPGVDKAEARSATEVYAHLASVREVTPVVNRALVQAGIDVLRLNPHEDTLEQRYFDITREAESTP